MATASGARVSNLKSRRSLRRRRESEEENIYLDFSREPSDLLQEVLFHLVKLDVSKGKKLGYLNGLVRFCNRGENLENAGYSYKDIFCCVRVPLFHEACEVRAASLRACRYLLRNVESTKAFCAMKLHYVVARSLDVLLDNRLERMHALRLMRKFLSVNPREFPSTFTKCLVAIANEVTQERELLRACLASLSQLSLLNPEEFIDANGITVLLKNVMECQQPKITEAVLGVLLHLFNEPKTRNMIKNDISLEHLLAPFTDSHYRYLSEINDNVMSDDRTTKLSATKIALVTVLRSWSGIAYLCQSNEPQLHCLVEMLYLPYADIRRSIIELFFEIFDLHMPEWTEDFSIAMTSADPSAVQSSWQLYEGYVVAEGCCVLPYFSKDRTNLMENYFALLLLLFVRAGLLEALADVINSDSIHLAVWATILLGELLFMCNKLLPSDCCHHCNSLPSLISSAAAFKSPHEQNQASAAVTCLLRIHELKKDGCVPKSLVLDNLMQICDPDRKRISLFSSAVNKVHLSEYIKRDMTEVINLAMKDTGIFSKEFHSWDWELIDSILQNPVDALKKFEDTSHRTFVQKLMHFFKPYSKQFSDIEAESVYAQKIILTGYHFMEFLLQLDEVKSLEYIEEFLADVNSCLAEVTKDSIPVNAVLSPSKVLSTVSHAYFIFVGKLSCSSNGCNLLAKCGTFSNLQYLLITTNHNVYVKLIISVLDYSQDGFSRTLLAKALTATSEYTRLYATNFLRILLRAGLPDYRKWAIELLVRQLYDLCNIVAIAAVGILDEACNVQENLEALVSIRPSLIHLGDKGFLLAIRFFSIPSGLKYFQESSFLNIALKNWREVYNMKYVKIVEDLLNEALTRHRKNEDGTYGRRSSDTHHTIHNVYLPHHLFAQLVQHNDGLEILLNENFLPNLLSTIYYPDFSSELQLLELKAALWAVGHIGSYPLGLSVLLKENVIPVIIQMAANAPVLSIRGTCFFVLGVLSSTPEGSVVLAAGGWESVCRNHSEKWPIVQNSSSEPVATYPHHAWSFSSSTSYWPPCGLPYTSSFTKNNEQMSNSPSSQSLDVSNGKACASSSFSSVVSMQVHGNENIANVRPRSSSDCQTKWKDTESIKAEVISWDSFDSNSEDKNGSDIVLKERSVSSYEMGNAHCVLEVKPDRSNSDKIQSLYQSGMHLSIPADCTSVSSSYKYEFSQYSSILKQLSHGHSCNLRSPPSPDDVPEFMFTSSRDAQGFSTLKNIQRRRVQSLCLQDLSSYNDVLDTKLHPFDARSDSVSLHGDILHSRSNSSLKSFSSNEVHEIAGKMESDSKLSPDARFIGLCLPSSFDSLFKITYEPIALDKAVPCLVEDHMGLQLHTIDCCLACHVSHVNGGLLRTTIDEEAEELEHTSDVPLKNENLCNSDKKQNLKGAMRLTEESPEGKALVRKEVMKCVTNLSSSIAVKASEQGLLSLKQKFPNAFHDICLYSEICLIISKYNFQLSARRFLQELFLDADFSQLQLEAESILGITNLPQGMTSEI